MSGGLWITFEGGDGSGKTTQAALLEEWFEAAGRTVVRTREPGGTAVGRRIREIVLHHRAGAPGDAGDPSSGADTTHPSSGSDTVHPSPGAGADSPSGAGERSSGADGSSSAAVSSTAAPRSASGADEPDIGPRAEALLFAADRAHHIEALVRPALARGDVVIQDRYLDSSVAYQGAGRVLDPAEVRDLSLWATGGALPDLTVLLDIDADAARARLDADDKPFDRMEAQKAEFHARVREAFLTLAAAEPGRFLVLDATAPRDEIAAAIRTRVAAL